MKVFELQVSERNELWAQRHFCAHCCAWVAMDICFSMKLVVSDSFATLGIAYKYEIPFISFILPVISKAKQHFQ
jgi:hypothetical protein